MNNAGISNKASVIASKKNRYCNKYQCLKVVDSAFKDSNRNQSVNQTENNKMYLLPFRVPISRKQQQKEKKGEKRQKSQKNQNTPTYYKNSSNNNILLTAIIL